MDGDEDFDGELEGLDITACKEKIAVLQAERERRREATERLQEKLKALNYELAARREEADTQRRRLKEEMEQNKRLEEKSQAAKEHTEGTINAIVPAAAAEDYDQEKVRSFIEQQLDSSLPRRPPCNQLGIRIFDERDLMVEKPQDMEKAEQMYVDTVLITHWRSSSSEHKFHLSYRVSRNTTARKLREDACLYWGISEVEYILWTLNNAKVHDDLTIQTCFKPEEKAHLILAPKTPKKIEPPERVIDAIRPKIGPKSRTVKKKQNVNQNLDVQQGVAKPENFYEQMAKAPGLFEFMTQRDRNVKTHKDRIRPCSLCVYALLFLQTCLCLAWLKPNSHEFLCRLGVHSVMVDSEQAFREIRDEDAAWGWLTYSVPRQLFDNTSGLRTNNYLPSWVRVRMQQVKPASSEECLQQELPGDIGCFSEYYTDSSAETADIQGVKSYWSGVAGLDGRSNETFPWKFMTGDEAAEDHEQGYWGHYQRYDPSGYAVDYHLQHDNLTAVYEAWVADMVALRSAGWISNQTRAVHLSFVAYNPNFDFWVSSLYIVEFPLHGIAWPISDVGLFRRVLNRDMTMGTHLLAMDIDRLVLIALVLVYQILWEIRYERKKSGGAWRYFFGSQGLADLGIVAVYLWIFIDRYLNLVLLLLDEGGFGKALFDGYLGMAWRAEYYRDNLILEAFLLALTGWRLFAFMKINRHVFLIWDSLNEALNKYVRFLMIFLPVLGGFIQVAHAYWRAHLLEFRSFWSSATSLLMMLLGENTIVNVGEVTRPGTWVVLVSLYLVVILFLVNSWSAILMQEYQKTRIAAGFRPKEYTWSEYELISWLLPSLLKKGYLKIRKSIVPIDDED